MSRKIGNNSFLHLAVQKDKLDMVLVLLEHGVDIAAINDENRTPFDFLTTEGKVKLFSMSKPFSFKLLSEHNYQMWFYIIQLSEDDISGISEQVFIYTQSNPQLARAMDSIGRFAEDVATMSNKDAIRRAYLLFGRYRLMDASAPPDHTSKTCTVYRAWDEMDGSKKVALKLMRMKAQWQREQDVRRCGFDEEFVINVINTLHPGQTISQAPEEIPEEAMAESGIVALSKSNAERLFCLVMPLADRNMYVALKQERWAPHNLGEIRHSFTQIVKAVSHLHDKGIVHADIKTLNLIRRENRWILIDLDAACRIGVDEVGFKSSTSIMPPESIYADYDTDCIYVKSKANMASGEALLAHPSFDIWSLGVILYQMCNIEVKPLFEGGQDDNLSSDKNDTVSLWTVYEWKVEVKAQRLAKVKDPAFRNLIGQLLSKDPAKRPTASRILAHPALTGKSVTRMVGEQTMYDIFLSYRVASDSHHLEKLYRLLTSRGLKVYWDKECLEPGVDWEQGFCEGLMNSRIFVPLLSRDAINHPDKNWQNFSKLTPDSKCDNVFLENRFAVELEKLGLIEKIFPLFIGDVNASTGQYNHYYSNGCHPTLFEVSVKSVEEKLQYHMESQGLGTPLEPDRTVKSVMDAITAHQGAFIEGDADATFQVAADVIVNMVMETPQPEKDQFG